MKRQTDSLASVGGHGVRVVTAYAAGAGYAEKPSDTGPGGKKRFQNFTGRKMAVARFWIIFTTVRLVLSAIIFEHVQAADYFAEFPLEAQVWRRPSPLMRQKEQFPSGIAGVG